MNIYGIIHYKNDKFAWLNTFKGYMVLIYIVVFNITQYFYIYENRNDLVRIASRGGSILLYASLLIKGFTTLIYQEKYCKIIDEVHENIKSIQASDNYEIQLILNKLITKSSLITKSVVTCVIVTVFIFNVYMILAIFVFAG